VIEIQGVAQGKEGEQENTKNEYDNK